MRKVASVTLSAAKDLSFGYCKHAPSSYRERGQNRELG
jgi:hypothetical protein